MGWQKSSWKEKLPKTQWKLIKQSNKLPLENIAIKNNYFREESKLILIKSKNSSKTMLRLLMITKRTVA